jgi:anti-sigma B factor antagonist
VSYGALFQPNFDVSTTFETPVAVVTVSGELDLATAPRLARALEGLPSAVLEVHLDLRAVWFADATAISRLLRAQRRLELTGRSVVVTRASLDVRHVMHMTGLESEFTFADVPPDIDPAEPTPA